MAYSETREFQNTEIIKIIEDAYRLTFSFTGKNPPSLTPDDLISARFSLNLILSSWANRGLNLWTVSRELLTLEFNKIEYELSKNIVDILEVSTRTSNRVLGGTAFSDSGDASLAFDGDLDTYCEIGSFGYIGYDYGEGSLQNIQLVGIATEDDSINSFSFEYSNDYINWTRFLDVPTTEFYAKKAIYFELISPPTARYYRLKNNTIFDANISEIYFNNSVIDIVVVPESRSNYMSYPSKYTNGRPSVYIINKLLSPSITFWPAPGYGYNLAVYNCFLKIQDIGDFSNSAAIPSPFYMALRDALAYEISLKMAPQISDKIESISEKSFSAAAQENVEKYIPLEFDLSMDKYS